MLPSVAERADLYKIANRGLRVNQNLKHYLHQAYRQRLTWKCAQGRPALPGGSERDSTASELGRALPETDDAVRPSGERRD